MLALAAPACAGVTDGGEPLGQVSSGVERRATAGEALSGTCPPAPLANVIATQDRLNLYFHRVVLPRMSVCWDRLVANGYGTVAVDFSFLRGDKGWIPGTTSVQSSNLPSGQDVAALRCLQSAMAGTSFAIAQEDGEAKEFQVSWSFPVPWPKDAKQFQARMIDTGGGGRGGCGGSEGPAPACFDCQYVRILGMGISFCANVCAGYSTCTNEDSGCNMRTPCATGSTFGNIGGVVMY